jgi:hypothetical protein
VHRPRQRRADRHHDDRQQRRAHGADRGRPDWNNPGATGPASLQIDRQRPRKLTGSYVANLFLVLVTDEALLKNLEGAKTLTWTMKVGKFQADVTGIGIAFAAVQACKASLPASPS